jgi:hypothetical protein
VRFSWHDYPPTYLPGGAKYLDTEYILLIEPVNGLPEDYTSHNLSDTFDSVLYNAESNQAPSRVPTRLKLNVDASETVRLGGAALICAVSNPATISTPNSASLLPIITAIWKINAR